MDLNWELKPSVPRRQAASAEPGGRWPGGALRRLRGGLVREYECYVTLLDFWGCCPSQALRADADGDRSID